jgi:hypothetical protein
MEQNIQSTTTTSTTTAISQMTDTDTCCTRIYVSGDRSNVGKSTVCMGLLGSFLQLGYPPESLGYIKPATQCEAVQTVTTFCHLHGIDTVPISPIVYYAGFTREYLAGRTAESSPEMLHRVSHVVDTLAHNKRILIIDGVGYPSVGSITGTSNAHLAIACGYPVITAADHDDDDDVTAAIPTRRRIPAPVLIVGKSGVGDAVDSFNLNSTFFEYHKVTVLGAIFNRLSLEEGFYSLPNCKKAVEQYFHQTFQDSKVAFGFIPEFNTTTTTNTNNNMIDNSTISDELKQANDFVFLFMKYVNVLKIISAARKVQQKASLLHAADTGINSHPKTRITTKVDSIVSERNHIHDSVYATPPPTTAGRIPLPREQIEEAARLVGAKAG